MTERPRRLHDAPSSECTSASSPAGLRQQLQQQLVAPGGMAMRRRQIRDGSSPSLNCSSTAAWKVEEHIRS